MSRLVADGVRYRIAGRPLIDGVSLAARPGHLQVIVGPNGAGKTTLLRLLTGDLVPDAGEVRLGDRPLGDWRLADLARERAVLSQQVVLQFAFSVTEVVAMGRAPYRDRDTPAVAAAAITDALRTAELDHLAERAYPTLSGGEQRRTDLARVLAQQTPVILLDEPTAGLDVRHQELVLSVARGLADRGSAVLAVLHDLNLAAAYADRVAVLDAGRLRIDAPPRGAFDPDLLGEVYGYPMHVVDHPSQDGPLVLPARRWSAVAARRGLSQGVAAEQ